MSRPRRRWFWVVLLALGFVLGACATWGAGTYLENSPIRQYQRRVEALRRALAVTEADRDAAVAAAREYGLNPVRVVREIKVPVEIPVSVPVLVGESTVERVEVPGPERVVRVPVPGDCPEIRLWPGMLSGDCRVEVHEVAGETMAGLWWTGRLDLPYDGEVFHVERGPEAARMTRLVDDLLASLGF